MRRSITWGIWVGLTVGFLLASLAMVQIRCRFFSGFSCGDWPVHGYTWHFVPPFVFVLVVWLIAAGLWRREGKGSLQEGLRAHGEAASPMLGLTLAWVWYGITDPAIHFSGGCTIPVLCHDAMPLSIVVWSAPWLAWGLWGLADLWRGRERHVVPDDD